MQPRRSALLRSLLRRRKTRPAQPLLLQTRQSPARQSPAPRLTRPSSPRPAHRSRRWLPLQHPPRARPRPRGPSLLQRWRRRSPRGCRRRAPQRRLRSRLPSLTHRPRAHRSWAHRSWAHRRCQPETSRVRRRPQPAHRRRPGSRRRLCPRPRWRGSGWWRARRRRPRCRRSRQSRRRRRLPRPAAASRPAVVRSSRCVSCPRAPSGNRNGPSACSGRRSAIKWSVGFLGPRSAPSS
jgi:hypothetical protein